LKRIRVHFCRGITQDGCIQQRTVDDVTYAGFGTLLVISLQLFCGLKLQHAGLGDGIGLPSVGRRAEKFIHISVLVNGKICFGGLISVDDPAKTKVESCSFKTIIGLVPHEIIVGFIFSNVRAGLRIYALRRMSKKPTVILLLSRSSSTMGALETYLEMAQFT